LVPFPLLLLFRTSSVKIDSALLYPMAIAAATTANGTVAAIATATTANGTVELRLQKRTLASSPSGRVLRHGSIALVVADATAAAATSLAMLAVQQLVSVSAITPNASAVIPVTVAYLLAGLMVNKGSPFALPARNKLGISLRHVLMITSSTVAFEVAM
jgi:hypothetical protein